MDNDGVGNSPVRIKLRAPLKSPLAKDSRLNDFYSPGDFVDCFTLPVKGPQMPIQQIAQGIFLDLPGWIRALLAIRDFGVTPFGLKTTASLTKNSPVGSPIEIGDHINFLCVRSVWDDEIIVGEDDHHLDFRISVHRAKTQPELVSLATWVRCHNAFGRFYLSLIKPFHEQIVRSQLRKLAKPKTESGLVAGRSPDATSKADPK